MIDPGQAFGTGTHPSTWLALGWVDRLAGGLARGARVLDVGTGSGVLALAAAALAPVRAVAFDLDPIAAREARANAARNGCAERVAVFAGTLDALAGPGLRPGRRESAAKRSVAAARGPCGAHAPRRAGGLLGLLEAETEAFREAALGAGFTPKDVSRGEDASGERWAALLTVR